MSGNDPRIPPSWREEDEDEFEALVAEAEWRRHRRRPERRRRRWPRAGWAIVILLVIIVAGNLRQIRDDGPERPAPAPTSAALVATTGSGPSASLPPSPPAATVAIVSAVPATLAVRPLASATPAPRPTADPRFADIVICLDPGHGGWDRGYLHAASAAAPAMEEATLNLAMALALRDELEARGFTVVLTREGDTAVNEFGGDVNADGRTFSNQTDPAIAARARSLDELQARIDICNKAGADLLISMHLNGFPDLTVSGYETWYSSARAFVAQNRLIASLVFEELGIHLPAAGYNANGRQVNDDASARVASDREIFDRYVITGPAQPGEIEPSEMPGTIVESLFISNDADAAFLHTPQGQNAIVAAYAAAITRYAMILLGPAGDT